MTLTSSSAPRPASSGAQPSEWRENTHHSPHNAPLNEGVRRLGRQLGHRVGLPGLLLGTTLLYLVGLSGNGWANEYYAAAAEAGSRSWTAFLFGSLDSANFITVDKPPASLWVMDLSVRLFGLNSWSILVPQALEGVAAVAVLYLAVGGSPRRRPGCSPAPSWR